MSNPFDALRKVIEHEANQDDDGGFFARLGGLEPDPEDDGPTARGLFQHWDTERDGPAVKWPPRTQPPLGSTMSDITGQTAIRAINSLLKDHYPVDDGIWGKHCATCMIDAGATGADHMDWPCDIYATIQDAIGDQSHDR